MTVDALARRDWHVHAQARRLMAAGVTVPTDALQRQSAEDLRLVDNATAAGALRRKVETKKAEPPPPATGPAAGMAARMGAKFYQRALPARTPVRHTPRVTGNDAIRLAALAARIKLIGQRVTTIGASDDLENAFEFRGLARALVEHAFNHKMGMGLYAGKSAADRDRIYQRAIEDICDRSNAVIRPNWWAK